MSRWGLASKAGTKLDFDPIKSSNPDEIEFRGLKTAANPHAV
jgi:hypothetical protein